MRGASPRGSPLPTRVANFFVGLVLVAKTLASHSGRAITTVNTRWLEILMTHGTRPARLIMTSMRNKEANSQEAPWIGALFLLFAIVVACVSTVPINTLFRFLLGNCLGEIRAVIRYAILQKPAGVRR